MAIIEKLLGEIDIKNLELPIGYVEDGVVYKKCSIKEMDGFVEEAMLEPKIRENSGKMITELVFGILENIEGIPRINRDIVRKLTTIDRDFLVIAHFKEFLSDNGIAKWVENCPECGKPNEFERDLNELIVRYLTEDESKEFTCDLYRGLIDKSGETHKKLTFILPNGEIQEKLSPVVKINQAQATSVLLQAITKRIGTKEPPFVLDTFKKLSTRDRNTVSKALTKLKFGVDVTYHGSCAYCTHEFTSTIPFISLMGE